MAIIPNNNIDTRLVANTIGVDSDDVGVLCGGTAASAGRINKWAKYKPVRYPADFTEGHPNWWKDAQLTCGLDVPRYTSLESMIADLRAGGGTWSYKPPRGGPSEPFRLGDFRNYNHDAVNPVRTTSIPADLFKDVTPSIGLSIDKPSIDRNYNLSLLDLDGSYNVNGFYAGVAVFKSGSTSGVYVTDSTVFSDPGGGGVPVNISGLDNGGVYDFVYILSSTAKLSIGPVTSPSVFIVSPSIIQRVTVYNEAVASNVHAQWLANKSAYTIYFSNGSNNAISVTSITLFLVYRDWTIDSVFESGETSVPIQGQSVPAKSGIEVRGTQVGLQQSGRGRKAVLRYTVNGVVKTREYGFIEES